MIMAKFKPAIKVGFSLVEIILAVALFGLFVTALVGLLMNSYGSNFQAEEKDKATLAAQQGLEAVWSIRRQAWNLLENGNHGLSNANGYWEFLNNSDLLEDKYTRTITIADACRNISGNIVDCSEGGAVIDLYSKKVTSKVTYPAITGINSEVELISYLTTWQSKNWLQTDWSSGSGQSRWFDDTRYWTDDGNIDYSSSGEIKLKNLGGGCGTKIWPFSTPADYTYDPTKIEITGGFAQLKAQAGGSSGTTLNPDFDLNTNNWTYDDWDQGSGEVNVSGIRHSTLGNPSGWVDINIPKGRDDKVGGFWRQAFTTTVNNPIVTVNFDWQVTQYNPTPNTFQLYVFVDNSPGAPIVSQQVWSSGEITATRNWTSQTNIDASSKVTTAGTYYLKIAVWIETSSSNTGPFTIGYDNVKLDWSGTGISYPTNQPTVNPNASYLATGIERWNSFAETAQKNGGEIYYQLSDDDGVTWYYWNGATWSVAGSNNYNAASVVNTNISSFPTTTAKIMFKSFLNSDGTQQVKLDEVEVSCAKFYTWPFSTPADYTYDPAKIEVAGGFAQLITQAGSPVGGQTTNPDFNIGLSPWTFGRWGTANPTGSWASSGGNPGGNAQIQFPLTKNRIAGGYFEQSFAVTAQTIAAASLNLDWRISQYTRLADNLTLYVFVDTTSGNPTIGQEVWSSGNQSGTRPWTSVTNIDVRSKITGPGTYYLKIVVYVDYPTANAQYTVGYDNVWLIWSGTATSGYPIDNPNINPVISYSAPTIEHWTSFAETAQKNGGEIYYQLSDNDGATWYYWNGATWSVAGASQYSPADIVNTNISYFPTTTAKIMFKSFLESDGTQPVKLDRVTVGFGQGAGALYATQGQLESSAFNTGNPSAFNFLSWVENIPSDSQDIQVQLATAPDSSGIPGSWSDWLGPLGANTYYESGAEILIPLSNGHNDDQWLKYKVILKGDGSNTPVLEEIKINYTP